MAKESNHNRNTLSPSIEFGSKLLEELIKTSRKLELDYEYACDGAPEGAKRVRTIAGLYLDKYADFNKIDHSTALSSYMATIRRYASDIEAFSRTGRYPLELDSSQAPLSRTDYDLFLMLTILLTKHRCSVMEELGKFPAGNNALVVGVGSGVELNFVGTPEEGDAYDVYINSFARSRFLRWRFWEKMYYPAGKLYESVYALELLEHLDSPYAFLLECAQSLVPGGRLVVTTATNVPQFDHRYNFVSDDEFEGRASGLGLRVEHKRIIPHAYPRTDIGARNVFYAFKKD